MFTSVQKNAGFLKSPAQWVFGVLLVFGLYCVFRIFYLNEHFDSLFIDLKTGLNAFFSFWHCETNYKTATNT